jgi:hypothetical protein
VREKVKFEAVMPPHQPKARQSRRTWETTMITQNLIRVTFLAVIAAGILSSEVVRATGTSHDLVMAFANVR